jgi:hypothetical protein
MTSLLKLDAIARSTPQVARMRKRYKRKTEKVPAVLGKGDGNDPYYGAGNNRIWVRRDGAANDDGDIGQTLPEKVFCGSSNYFAYDGARCFLELDPNGQWQVSEPDNQDCEASGRHTGKLNAGNPTNKWFRMRNATRLKCLPVGTDANPSTLVGVRGITTIDNYGDFNRFTATGTVANKLDLASYIPGAGLHAVIVVWWDTVNNSVVATSSTAQANTTELDETDYQEAFDNQTAESIPLQGFHLGDAQTSITIANLGEDVRPWVNMPQALGFPNPVDKDAIIRDSRTERVCDDITVTANLEVAGHLEVGSMTVSGSGSLTITGSGSVTDIQCDPATIEDEIDAISPILIEIDDTNSPYTATTESIDITIVCNTTSGNIEVDLPTITGNKNQRYSVVNVGTGTVTIDPNGAETIIGESKLDIYAKYDAPRMVATSQEWILI